MIRVLIADDHPIFREGIRRILEGTGSILVIGEASSGPETVESARANRPDVVLLDVSMPGRGGIETAQDLKRLRPGPRILMLSAHPEDSFAVRCLREGADGYMTKDASPDQLVGAIRRLHSGHKYVSPTLAERLALHLDRDATKPPHERLSSREFEIMLMIGAGKTVSEIASELHLSVKTVSTYRTRLLEKMSMKNNAEVMRYVLEERLDQ